MKVRYIGTESYQEYPLTGTTALWQPQWVSDVSDYRADKLVALGTFVYDDESTFGNQLDSRAAELAAMGSLVSGEWQYVPSIFRLQMTGTGTVTLDSRDSLGNITTGVYTVTLSGATNEIGFPYAGDAAVEIRATLTGTATAKVI